VTDVSLAEAERMVKLRQARWACDKRVLQIIDVFTPEHEHPCRTRTSRGGPLGGQLYTTSTHGRVDGFKRIFVEDLGVFHAAILDCLRVMNVPAGTGVWYVDGATGRRMEVEVGYA
jgi:hypothetical protein